MVAGVSRVAWQPERTLPPPNPVSAARTRMALVVSDLHAEARMPPG